MSYYYSNEITLSWDFVYISLWFEDRTAEETSVIVSEQRLSETPSYLRGWLVQIQRQSGVLSFKTNINSKADWHFVFLDAFNAILYFNLIILLINENVF